MELSAEERRKVYEEEKAKLLATEETPKRGDAKPLKTEWRIALIALLTIFALPAYLSYRATSPAPETVMSAEFQRKAVEAREAIDRCERHVNDGILLFQPVLLEAEKDLDGLHPATAAERNAEHALSNYFFAIRKLRLDFEYENATSEEQYEADLAAKSKADREVSQFFDNFR